nr:hypothetical protein [uncultured Mediterranean phage uvMED]
MSKIKLTGSNSGYVEIASAADAGNLTLTLPTAGTALLSNAGNVFSGITTTGQLDINGSIDVSSTSVFNDDLTLTGASYNVLWDKSDNQLEFGDNAKLSFGGDSDMQLYHIGGANSYIVNKANNLYVQSNNAVEIGSVDTNGSSVETSAKFIRNGSSELYFNDVKKFQTTNTGAIVTGICTATSFSGSGEGLTYTSPLSHRNIIINGDMRVAQRATSASMSDHGATYDVCDRWQYNRHGVTATLAQVAETPAGRGFKYSLKLTTTSAVGSIGAGNMLSFLYRIEGQDIRRLGYGSSNAKTATISFWVRGSLSGKIGVNCARDSRTFSTNEDIVANTWKFVEIVIPADTSTGLSAADTAAGFDLAIRFAAGSNFTSGTTGGSWINFHTAYAAGFTAGQQGAYLTTNGSTIQVTGVQLEMGSVATPFEHRSYQDELMRCYRYFYAHSGQGVNGSTPNPAPDTNINNCSCQATTSVSYNIPLPVPMRVVPTLYSTVTGSTRYRVNSAGANTNSGSNPTINAVLSTHNMVSGAVAGFSGLVAGQAANVRRYLGTGILGFQAEL